MRCLEFWYFLVSTVMLIPEVESLNIDLTTKLGSIIGISENVEFNGETKNVTRFLGIPYAKSPTGDRRFYRPTPYGDYTQAYNATYFRPHCMQSELTNPSVRYFQMSEDCLHLNIFIPGNKVLPENRYAVMVFIHGGGFTFSGAEVFSGDVLSVFHDVVVVTVNYRLNTFGFLSNGTRNSGNMGLWDQKLAIQWVHDNIADFSGDPENVTLFGNSAGAASVLYQALNPTNKGLFHRVIAQSGSVLAQWAQQYDPAEMFAEFVSDIKCNMKQYDEVLKCLQSKTAEELVTSRFSPVVDGDFIVEDPSVTFSKGDTGSSSPLNLFTEVDFLSGVQSKESADMVVRLAENFGVNIANGLPRNVFENQFVPSILLQAYGEAIPRALVQGVLHQYTDWSRPDDAILIRDKMVDLSSDLTFSVPAINVIKRQQALRKPGKTSYFYVFNHNPPFAMTPLWLQGSKHTMELPYVFGLPDSMKIAAGLPPDTPLVIPPAEFKLSSIVMKMWTNFAKTGNPNLPVQIDLQGVPSWPQYDHRSQSYLEFSSIMTSESVKNHFAASRVEFWTTLVPLLEKCVTCMDKNCTENQQISLAHSITKNTFQIFLYILFVQMIF